MSSTRTFNPVKSPNDARTGTRSTIGNFVRNLAPGVVLTLGIQHHALIASCIHVVTGGTL